MAAFPLMASSMELEKDRPFDALVDDVIPTIKQRVRVGRFAISGRRPIRTRSIARWRREDASCSTRSDIGCSRCHGGYDGRGNVDWPGVHTDVGTDRARLRRRLGRVHRRVQRQPARGRRRAGEEPRLCGDAADRRVGQLSRIFTTAACRRCITCSGPVSSGRGSFR